MRIIAVIALLLGLLTNLMSGQARAADAPATVKVEFRPAENEAAPGLKKVELEGYPNPIYVPANSEVTNADIAEAKVTQDQRGGAAIEIVFTDEGAEKMHRMTSGHLLKPLAILIDGKVITAPRIVSAIRNKAQITGAFSQAEAERIAEGIKRGVETSN